MSRDIRESDWKCFKKIHPMALRRHCDETMKRLAEIASDASDDPHDSYLKAYEYIMKRDKEVALLFNEYRRSTALSQLTFMMSRRVISASDLEGLSEEALAYLVPPEEEC